MSLAEQILLLNEQKFWIIVGISSVAAIVSLYFAFHFLRRVRIIEDTPTASIRSAYQGYVELAGTALQMDGEPILAPLTGLPCCWYSFKIERRGDKGWFTAASGTSDHLFLLQDATGNCIIDPEGADVTSDQKDVWQGDTPLTVSHSGNKLPSSWNLLIKLGQSANTTEAIGPSRRYTERRIHSGDQLYAIGLFKTLDEMDHIEHRSEITRELLREWKKDKPSLLFEFDRNRDGEIDQQEWEQVRQKAEAQAQQEHRQLIDGSIINTLSDTGSKSRPFLISTLTQFDLVRRFRLYILLSLVLFFTAGATAAWMLSLKLTAV
jgi:hypothetical protein